MYRTLSKRSSVELARQTTMLEMLMYAASIVFWLSGAVSVAVGLWLRQEKVAPVAAAVNNQFLSGFTVFAVAGLVVCLVGFLGFAVVISERSRLALTYTFLVAVALSVFLAFTGWSFAGLGLVGRVVEDEFPASMEKYAHGGQVKAAIDDLQKKMKCCGLRGPADWTHTPWAHGRPLSSVPDSCCSVVPATPDCGIRSHDKPWAAFSGCQGALHKVLHHNLRDLAVTAAICCCAMFCVLGISILYWRHLSRGLNNIWPQSTDVVVVTDSSTEQKDDICLAKAALKKELELEEALHRA